ncbi:class I SAM-dependent methyltransferase [Rhizobium sp. A22-96]
MLFRLYGSIRELFGGTVRGTSANDLSPTLVTPSWVKPRQNRSRRLRQYINETTKVLEIGPLARPIAPKRKGYNAYIVDNMDREGLLRQYAHAGYDPSSIEEVDFVWSSGDLADVVPEEHHATFEVIVLSHVLEHMPNPLAFFSSCARLLKPGGYVTLALPDKRHCFDLFRPVTTTAQWLAAFRAKTTAHNEISLFDYATLAVARRAEIAWDRSKHKTQDLTFLNMNIESAYARYFSGGDRNSNSYEDCHASVFTPASFALVAQECHAIGVSRFALDYVSITREHEFIAHLRLEDRKPISHHDRIQLLALSAKEQSVGYRGVKIASRPIWSKIRAALSG